jgi:type II secretory pathway pseudopilin PulG
MEGKKSGFTLLQLIIVVVVIAILAGVMIGTFVSVVRSAREANAKQQAACEAMIKSNEDLIDIIKNSNKSAPDTDAIAKAVSDAVKESFGTGSLTTVEIDTDALVDKLTVVVNNAVTKAVSSQQTLTRTDITNAVEEALKNNTPESSSTLTIKEVEDIVKTYVIRFTTNLATTDDINYISQQLQQLESDIMTAISGAAEG